MEEKDNLDIDEEMTKSLQRLVEEETNVAKASINNDLEENSTQPNKNNNITEVNMNLGTTRFIDTDLINAKVASNTIHNNKDTNQNIHRNIHENILQSDNTKHDSLTRVDKRKKIMLASICGIAAVLIIGIIITVVIHNNKKSSYSYNYEMGMNLYKEGNYIDSIQYLEVALASAEGKKNMNMMYTLSEAYKITGNIDKAIEILETSLEYNKFDESTLSLLLKLCYDNKRGEKINEIIEEYKDSQIKNILDEYIVAVPTTSETPGNFEHSVELNLLAQDGCIIYYTIDESTPTRNSIKFTDTIQIEKDTVTIKAIAINDIGVQSEVGEFKFTIDLKAPEAPVLDMEDSKIKVGTIIRIKNLVEGDKAYYTVDGTTPSVNSLPYNDGIELQEGNYMLSVIVINKYNLSSTVTRKNVTVKDETEYTYNEALNFLKKRMQELNIIESNGKFSVSGETADFVYQTKQEISGIQMYYIRLDKKSASGSTVEGYYGVGVSNGQCYKITASNDSLSAVVY